MNSKKIGRPKLTVTKEKVSVTLPPDILKALRVIGKGNVSLGVERVYKEMKELAATQFIPGELPDEFDMEDDDLFS